MRVHLDHRISWARCRLYISLLLALHKHNNEPSPRVGDEQGSVVSDQGFAEIQSSAGIKVFAGTVVRIHSRQPSVSIYPPLYSTNYATTARANACRIA